MATTDEGGKAVRSPLKLYRGEKKTKTQAAEQTKRPLSCTD